MSAITSSVTWSIILSFVFGGLNEVIQVVPAGWAAVITAIITALGIYLHKGQIVAGKAR